MHGTMRSSNDNEIKEKDNSRETSKDNSIDKYPERRELVIKTTERIVEIS